MKQALTHGSLFSGIGGFDLGAQLSGIHTEWNCELLEFNRNFLKNTFPETEQYGDITTMQKPIPVDIISAGFPCQNISIAASKNRDGINGEKSGLWRHIIRICEAIKPSYLIIENSSALINKGLSEFLREFAKIGYDAEWQTLRGFQFGIPQRRRRLYVVLYTTSIGNRMEKEQIFSGWHKPQYPTWRDSEAKVYGMGDVISDRVDKHRSLGNAVQPLIAHYLFELVKANYERFGN